MSLNRIITAKRAAFGAVGRCGFAEQMDKRIIALAAFGLLSGAAPAQAAVTISTTGGNSATSGPSGNIATFSSGGVSVQVSAWSLNGFSLGTAWLGQYATGLGVTNASEGSGTTMNSSSIDNQSGTDFLLLVFNQAVDVQSAVLTPYQVSSAAANNAVTVSYATLPGAYTSPVPTGIAANSSVWFNLIADANALSGNTTSPYSVALNPSANYGNVWLLAAGDFGTGSPSADGFRLSAITVSTSPVPEPSTWALFFLGFGLLAASLRQRTRQSGRLLQLA